MAQTLPTTPTPSEASSCTFEQRVNTLQFGNGYQQDAVSGINNEFEVWRVVYTQITAAQYSAIRTVLSAAGSWDVINWTAPGGTAKKYKMDKAGYTMSRVAATYNLSFTLKQVY